MATNIPDTHILVVDDDDRLRALLKQYLGEHGYFVSTAANTREADELLATFAIDLMVLDVMMPKETGLQYAKRLRQAERPIPPILLLTARGDAQDRINGLEAGAGDYLPKPFAPRELVLRMENMLRRQPATPVSDKKRLRFGEYVFDHASGRLSGPMGPIYLTTSEIECLRILGARAGTPVSREEIAQLAGDLNNERSVDVQINRLRKKIEPAPGKPIYIQTVRHAGYVLHGEEVA
jgi:two-component system phosphate regulon response regulator OmpR